MASDVFCFRHWYFSFFCPHALTEIDNYWTWLSLPLFRNNIVAFEIIVDVSAAMNMLQGSCYFSENSIRHMFLAPSILKSLARKITYRLFDTNIFKVALQKQTILPLKEQVHWSGDCELNEPFAKVDPREALAAAKSRAHRQGSRSRITAQSNTVVGHGKGRATRELDLIRRSNLYKCINVGKSAIKIYVSSIDFFLTLMQSTLNCILELVKNAS